MRWRYVSITYQFGGTSPSLERHFRELSEAMLLPPHHYGYLQPAAAWRPPMDIHETADAITVKIELAGMREEDIEIILYPNALVITGRREDDYGHDEATCFHEAQIRYGPFRADVLLNVGIQQDAAEATYADGYLRIRLPKSQPVGDADRTGDISGARASGPAGEGSKLAAPASATGAPPLPASTDRVLAVPLAGES